MIEDFRKSVNSILYQRATSPFWGAVLISWVTWNWRILYVTLIVDSAKLQGTKLEFIEKNLLNDDFNLIIGPIITTIALLTVFPLISNGVYWLYLKFKVWKDNVKKESELKTLVGIEESIQLKTELFEFEQKFEKLTQEKDNRINSLEKVNSDLLERKLSSEKENKDLVSKVTSLETNLNKMNAELDFSNIWQDEWIYEVTRDNFKEAFWITDKKIFRVDGTEKFKLYKITNSGTKRLEIFMRPFRSGSSEHEIIKIIEIERTSKIDEYKGGEVKIVKKENGIEVSENEIRIYKAPRFT